MGSVIMTTPGSCDVMSERVFHHQVYLFRCRTEAASIQERHNVATAAPVRTPQSIGVSKEYGSSYTAAVPRAYRSRLVYRRMAAERVEGNAYNPFAGSTPARIPPNKRVYHGRVVPKSCGTLSPVRQSMYRNTSSFVEDDLILAIFLTVTIQKSPW